MIVMIPKQPHIAFMSDDVINVGRQPYSTGMTPVGIGTDRMRAQKRFRVAIPLIIVTE